MKRNHKEIFIYYIIVIWLAITNPVMAGIIQNLTYDNNYIKIYLDNVEKIRIINNNSTKVTLIFADTNIYNIYRYDFESITKSLNQYYPFITSIQLVQYSLDPLEARLLINGDTNFNVKVDVDDSQKVIILKINPLELPKLIIPETNTKQLSNPKISNIPDFDLENVLKLLSENNIESAKSILTSEIAKNNNNLWAKYYLSQILVMENKLSQAEDLNNEIIKISRDFFDSYFAIAIIKDKEGKTDEAINYYLKTLAINPEHQEGRFRLAIDFLISEKYDKSIDEFKKLLIINPNYTPALENIGLAYLKTSDYDKAEQYFKKSIRTDSINNLANILIEKKQTDLALKLFSLANEINPNNSIILYNLAKVYQIKDDKDKAIEYYKKAIDQNKNLYNAHYNLGLIYASQGEDSKAVEELLEYLKLNPLADDAQTVKNMIQKLQEFN